MKIQDFDLFFLSYDEPTANLLWQQLVRRIPWAKRVHGIKGFDAAYKACAKESKTDRFFTVDGDNEVLPAFEEITIPKQMTEEEGVLSWGAKNSINGLCYGNGGIKNWRKDVALKMNSHETDPSGKNVDFCFEIPYIQMSEVLSVARIHDSPYQAFRAGFREGIKLSLVKGKKQTPTHTLKEMLWWENLDRLRIWCSVGIDRDCGDWAIYGARLGVYSLFLNSFDPGNIADYGWFDDFWKNQIWPKFHDGEGGWERARVISEIQTLESPLKQRLGLDITLLNDQASSFFRSVYINPTRSGKLLL